MVALAMIVHQAFTHGISQRALAKEDLPLNALGFRCDRKNRSMNAFMLGLWGGKRNETTSSSSSSVRKRLADDASRSMINRFCNLENHRRTPLAHARLVHPGFVRISRATSEMHSTGRQLHCEKQIEGHKSIFRPDFDRREINRGKYVPMGFRKVDHDMLRLRSGAGSMA